MGCVVTNGSAKRKRINRPTANGIPEGDDDDDDESSADDDESETDEELKEKRRTNRAKYRSDVGTTLKSGIADLHVYLRSVEIIRLEIITWRKKTLMTPAEAQPRTSRSANLHIPLWELIHT